MSTLTMKFGGSAVGTLNGMLQVLHVVQEEFRRRERLLLVVSALEGVTDALLEAAFYAQRSDRRGYRRIVANMRTRHMALTNELPLGAVERGALQADLDRLLFDVLDLCQQIADSTADTQKIDHLDSVVSVGERLAARIIASLLRENDIRGVAIDATHLIVTDAVFGHATPDMALTQQKIAENLLPMLDRHIVPVITGFIGTTADGRITTLGRGGSDYTAAIVGICANTDEVWMWGNVDGMMTTDPQQIKIARTIPELGYDEVAELAYFGAHILHARTIPPLRERNIPIRVANIHKPTIPGTRIHNIVTPAMPTIKAVTTIQGIGLFANRSGSLAEISQLVDNTLMDTIGNHAEVMISAQSSAQTFVCFVIPTSAGSDASQTVQTALINDLQKHPNMPPWDIHPVSIITAISAAFATHLELVAEILTVLSGIPILAIAQGASRCSVSIVTLPDDAHLALERIHSLVIQTANEAKTD